MYMYMYTHQHKHWHTCTCMHMSIHICSWCLLFSSYYSLLISYQTLVARWCTHTLVHKQKHTLHVREARFISRSICTCTKYTYMHMHMYRSVPGKHSWVLKHNLWFWTHGYLSGILLVVEIWHMNTCLVYYCTYMYVHAQAHIQIHVHTCIHIYMYTTISKNYM